MTSKNKVYGRWLIFSLIVLLIPITVSAVLYTVLIGFLQNSYERSERTAFYNVTATIDTKFNNVLSDVDYLANSEQFRKAQASDLDNSDKILFQKELKRIKGQHDFVARVYVYFNEDLIICDDFIMDLERLLVEDAFSFQFGPNQLVNRMKGENNREIIFKQKSTYGGNSFLFHTIYLGANVNHRATVMLTLDNDRLQTYIEDQLWEEDQAFILCDKSGNNFVSVGDSFTNEIDYNKLSNKISSNYFTMDYMMYSNRGGYSNLFLALLITVILAGGTSGALGIYLTVRNTRKQYRPLKEIIDMLDAADGDSGKIASTVQHLIEENRTIKNNFETSKELLINEFIFRLLKNQPFPMTRTEICQNYGLPFTECRFVLLKLCSHEIVNLVRQLPNESILSVQDMVFTKCKKLINKYFAAFEYKYVLEAEDSYYVLLAQKTTEPTFVISAIKDMSAAYRSAVNAEVSFQTSIAISTIAENMDGLNKAYNQVNEVMQFIGLLGSDNEVVYYPNITRSEQADIKHFKNTAEKENRLQSYIRMRDFTRAKAIMEEIINDDFNVRQNTQVFKYKVFSLINTIISSMQEMENSFGDAFVESLNPVSRLIAVDSVSALRKEAGKIFDECVTFINETQGEVYGWVQDVKDFVSKNYADPNLNVGMIADRFNFSLSYISRAFKKNIGQGIFDYIQHTRLNEAKIRLENHEKIGSVALAVGYFDSRTFIRAFKKYEGITPGKYK